MVVSVTLRILAFGTSSSWLRHALCFRPVRLHRELEADRGEAGGRPRLLSLSSGREIAHLLGRRLRVEKTGHRTGSLENLILPNRGGPLQKWMEGETTAHMAKDRSSEKVGFSARAKNPSDSQFWSGTDHN